MQNKSKICDISMERPDRDKRKERCIQNSMQLAFAGLVLTAVALAIIVYQSRRKLASELDSVTQDETTPSPILEP